MDEPYRRVFAEQEAEAVADRVPILNRTSVAYLRWLVQERQPKRMLEVGTAIGYSGLHLLQASPTATLVTLELDPVRIVRAKHYFAEAQVTSRVTLLEGDANETLDQLPQAISGTSGFDFVFIDAAKGSYAAFMEKAIRMCQPGALIVTDNILFRGLVAEAPEQVHRRHRSMVNKIKQFNTMLMEDPRLSTVIVPIGDGLALSVVKEEL
jgi:caffeoyl-CoA O-methyltransferase